MKALVAVCAIGCGSPRATSPASPATSSTEAAAADPSKPAPCPASFALANGTCGAIQSCGYPEGTCSCTTTGSVSCRGGAMMRPDPEPDPSPQPPPPPLLAWQCTPAVRADGCPGTEPAGACTTEGQRCRYGQCCVTELTCHDGQWGITMQACPP